MTTPSQPGLVPRQSCLIRTTDGHKRLVVTAHLHDVSPEEERDGPVGHDPKFPRRHGQLIQVIASGHEPPEESVEPETDNLGDPLNPAERCHLPEHPIVVRRRPRAQVPSETTRLTKGMLAGRRIKATGRSGIWDGGAVTQ